MLNKKIYFKGYHGHKNIGDDVFCVTMDWLCQNHWVKWTPVFQGEELPNLSKKSIVFKSKNINIRRISELWISIIAKRIIYSGGSVFSNSDFTIRNIKYYYLNYNFLSKKLGTIGTSIGPFKDSKDFAAIKIFLNKFKFIAVRDISSFEIAKDMNLESKTRFSFDLAILIDEVFPKLKNKIKKKDNERKVIGVSLCHYERYVGKDLKVEIEREEAIEKFIDSLLSRKENFNHIEEIVFFEFNGNKITGDREITEKFNSRVEGKVKSRIVKYTTNTEYFCEELSKCDFILGTRLHAGILAYSLNVPFFLVEYHKKCTEFLNTINHQYRFDVNDLTGNLLKYDVIKNSGFVPNIIPPQKFKEKMISELVEIEKVL